MRRYISISKVTIETFFNKLCVKCKWNERF